MCLASNTIKTLARNIYTNNFRIMFPEGGGQGERERDGTRCLPISTTFYFSIRKKPEANMAKQYLKNILKCISFTKHKY